MAYLTRSDRTAAVPHESGKTGSGPGPVWSRTGRKIPPVSAPPRRVHGNAISHGLTPFRKSIHGTYYCIFLNISLRCLTLSLANLFFLSVDYILQSIIPLNISILCSGPCRNLILWCGKNTLSFICANRFGLQYSFCRSN